MTTPPQGTGYVIQKGDTLWSIATRLLPTGATAAQINAKVADLIAWNPGIVPTALVPNTVLNTAPPITPPDPLAELRQVVAGLSDRETALEARVKVLEDAQKPAPVPTPVPTPPTPHTTLWGVNTGTAKQADAYAKLLGPIDVWRNYLQPGEKPHMPTEIPAVAGARLILSSKIKPQDIVTGAHDADFAALFAALGDNTFCPWHEPADDVEKGHFTVAQYRAAWDHLTPLARKTRVKLAPILMRATYAGQNGRKPADYLPDDYDYAGVDAYVAGGIGVSANQIGSLLDPVRAASSKPIVVGETGVGGKVTGQARIDTITALATYYRQAPDVAAVCWFLGSKPDSIEWKLSTAEAAAWVKAARE